MQYIYWCQFLRFTILPYIISKKLGGASAIVCGEMVNLWLYVNFAIFKSCTAYAHAQWFDYILKGRTLVFQA
jgi:hypothetical protein